MAYAAIIKAAEDYLQSSGSVGSSSSKSNKEIISAIKEKIKIGYLNVDVTDGTMLNYLSNAANYDASSGIYSGGPRGGYWYVPPEQEPPTAPKPIDEEKISSEKGKPVTVVEKDLYPLMELWREQKGYTAKDTSTLKSGGKGGNPDIIGADRVEIFGAVEVELASCEVKLGESN